MRRVWTRRAEEIAQSMFSLSANRQWEYTQPEPKYRCVDCGKEIRYPDTLCRDMCYEPCHSAVAA